MKVPPGVKLGTQDVFGDRMASGVFPGPGDDDEQVTVYTTVSVRQAQAEAPRDFTVDDSDAVVLGPGWWVDVYAATRFDSSGNIVPYWIVQPSAIARRTHGRLLAASG